MVATTVFKERHRPTKTRVATVAATKFGRRKPCRKEPQREATARAVLREVIRLPEQERNIVLGIVRQFGEERDTTGER